MNYDPDLMDLVDDLDEDLYDLDALRSDIRNGNFTYDGSFDDYHFCRQVLDSLTNGQKTQARQQARSFGDLLAIFEYAEEQADWEASVEAGNSLLSLARTLLSWATPDQN